jgi:hypothetical protein
MRFGCFFHRCGFHLPDVVLSRHPFLWIVVSIRIQTFRYQNEPIRCHVQVGRPGIWKGNAINSMAQNSRALETYFMGFSRDPSWNPGFNMRFQEADV